MAQRNPTAGSEYINPCVLKPWDFERTLLLLGEQLDSPLHLHDVTLLANFAFCACVYDEIVVPDPRIPILTTREDSFRIAVNIAASECTDLVRLRPVGELKIHPVFKAEISRLRDVERSFGERVDPFHDERLKILATQDQLNFFGRLRTLAEKERALLVFSDTPDSQVHRLWLRKEGKANIDRILKKSFGHQVLEEYRKTLHDKQKKPEIKDYDRVRLSVPFFLFNALQNAESGGRLSALRAIAALRGQESRAFRRLGEQINRVAPAERIALHGEKNKLIDELLEEGKRIPHPLMRLGLDLLAFVPAIASHDRAIEVPAKAREIKEIVEWLLGGKATIQYGLRLLNRIYVHGADSQALFEQLKRVFGDLSFDPQELSTKLDNSSLNDVF